MNTDAQVLIRNPDESVPDFNRRLAEVCKESDVTSVNLVVFHGTPIVTLMSEVDVPEGWDESKEPTDDDLEPVVDPLSAMVCRIRLTEHVTNKGVTVSVADTCARTEDVLNDVIARGNGAVTDIHYSQCPDTKEVFALVSFSRAEEVHQGEVLPPEGAPKGKAKKGDK
jgi:hypothetical protein